MCRFKVAFNQTWNRVAPCLEIISMVEYPEEQHLLLRADAQAVLFILSAKLVFKNVGRKNTQGDRDG
jgi:hypothetical protein